MMLIGRTAAGNHLAELTEREMGVLGKLIGDIETAASDLRGVLAFPAPLLGDVPQPSSARPPVDVPERPARAPAVSEPKRRKRRAPKAETRAGKPKRVQLVPVLKAILSDAGGPVHLDAIVARFEQRSGVHRSRQNLTTALARGDEFVRVGPCMYDLASRPRTQPSSAPAAGLSPEEKTRRKEMLKDLDRKNRDD